MRTKDKLTPRKDGRKWIRQQLSTTQYNNLFNQAHSAALYEAGSVIFSLHDESAFCGPISEVMGRLQMVRDYYEEQGYRQVTIDPRPGYEGGVENELYGYRLETKEELQKRLERIKNAKAAAKKREAKKRKAREERERKEFERLKKKFG